MLDQGVFAPTVTHNALSLDALTARLGAISCGARLIEQLAGCCRVDPILGGNVTP